MMTTTTTATANEPTNTLTIKALLVGDSDVGKTCSILALQGSEEYDLNAVECYDLCITLKALDSNKSKKLVICVQDTAGDPSFDEIRQCYYSCSNNLVIMFFSLISKPSLDNIKIKWLPEYKKYNTANCPVILVGTYVDKKLESEDTSITTEQGSLMAAEIGAIKYFEICATDPESTKSFYIEAARVALSYARHKNAEPPRNNVPTSPIRKYQLKRIPLPDIPVQTQSQKSSPRGPFSPPPHLAFQNPSSLPQPPPPLIKQQQQQQQQQQQRHQYKSRQHRDGLYFTDAPQQETSVAKTQKFVSEPILPYVSTPPSSPSPSPSPPLTDVNIDRGSQVQVLEKPMWSCGKPDKSKQMFPQNKRRFFTAKNPENVKPPVKERRSQSHCFGDGNEKGESAAASSAAAAEGGVASGVNDDARSMSSPLSPSVKMDVRAEESAKEAEMRPIAFDESGRKLGRRTKRRERMEEISALTKGNPACLDIQQILIEQSQLESQMQSNLPQDLSPTSPRTSPTAPNLQTPSQIAHNSSITTSTITLTTTLNPSTTTTLNSSTPLTSSTTLNSSITTTTTTLNSSISSSQPQETYQPQLNYQLFTAQQNADSTKKMRPPTCILYPGELQQNIGSSLAGVSHGARAKAVHFNVWVYRNVPLSPLIADLWEQSNEFCTLKLRVQAQKCVFTFSNQHGKAPWSVSVAQDALLAVEDSTRFFVLNSAPPIGLGFCTREESNAFVIEFMKKAYEVKNANTRKKKIIPFLKSTFKKNDSKAPATPLSSSVTSTPSSSLADPLASPPSSFTSNPPAFVIEDDMSASGLCNTKEFEVFHKLENKFASENMTSSSLSSSLTSTPLSSPIKAKHKQRNIIIAKEQVTLPSHLEFASPEEPGWLELDERDEPGVIISGEDRMRAIEAVKDLSTELSETIERSKRRVPEIKACRVANVEAEAARDRMYSMLTVERVRSRLNLEIKK